MSGCVSKSTPEAKYSNAEIKFRQGHIDAAIELADKGYRELGTDDSLWAWRFRILKAEMLIWRGAPEQATSLLEGTLPANTPSSIAARRQILRGRALCRVGKGAESDDALKQAEGLIGFSDDRLLAELAFAHARCSPDPAAARDYYGQTAKFAHAVDPFNEANAFLYLGFFSLEDRRYEEAISRYSNALALSDSFLLLKEKALGNLGYSYSQIGEFRRAVFFSQQAEQLAVDISNTQDQMRWLIDLGREHFHELEYSEAAASYSTALAIARDLRDPDDTQLCLHDLAQLALRIHDLNKAEGYIQELEGSNTKGVRHLDLLLDRAELAKSREDVSAAEDNLKQVVEQMAKRPGMDPAVRWTVQSDLGAVYEKQKKLGLAENMFRQAVNTAKNGWSETTDVESKISFLNQAPFYDDYVKFLVSRNRALEALNVAELGRSPTLSEGRRGSDDSLSLKRVQAALQKQGQVVLAYWLGKNESYLWVITPSQVKLIRLPPEREITNEVEAYNREIIEGGTLETLQKRGQNLYSTLVGPAATYIGQASSVIIVPHRNLYNLAFDTLVVPAPSPHYWMEDVKSYNMSFLNALLSSRPRRSAASKDLFLMGAPVLADKQFPVLQYAPAEMEKAAGHFSPEREVVISGKDATPAAYLAGHPGKFRNIHLVTHGTSSTVLENPLDAAIILSPVPGSAASTDPEGSYRLYGKDIMKTPLDADLVIISACSGTGREYSGEGLVGLAWAFLRAGAHQVIAALWEVDDASMPQLADDFYGEYTHDKYAAEALRDAKLRMLHSNDFHKRPYYWASLQLYTGY